MWICRSRSTPRLSSSRRRRARRLPNPEKKESVARGHKWRFGPLDKIIDDDVVYPVEMTFGTHRAKARFELNQLILSQSLDQADDAFTAQSETVVPSWNRAIPLRVSRMTQPSRRVDAMGRIEIHHESFQMQKRSLSALTLRNSDVELRQ